VHRNYIFRVHPLGAGPDRRFQLRIGMEGEGTTEFIPAHRTAFARCVSLGVAHLHEVDAHLELTQLLEWLASRWGPWAGAPI